MPDGQTQLARDIADEVCRVYSLDAAKRADDWGMPLTRRQRRVLDAILAHRAAHGCSPTIREIGAAVGLSVCTVFEHLGNLEEKGWIRRTMYRGRAIEVLDGRTGTGRLVELARRYAAGRDGGAA